jgi:hypothetical protein
MTRRAFITAVVTAVIAVVLNPISVLVGYYLSKSLAAPKLSIAYITPVVQTESLVLDKTLVMNLLNPRTPGPPTISSTLIPIYAKAGNFQCVEQLTSSLSLDCAGFIRTTVQDNLEILNTQDKQIKDDIRVVSTWDGRTPLSLPPLYLPGMTLGPIDFAFMESRQKDSAVASLRQMDRTFDSTIKVDTALLAALNSFLSQKPTRTGIIFRIGILNSGDSDGVIFPNATLAFLQNRQVKLINVAPSNGSDMPPSVVANLGSLPGSPVVPSVAAPSVASTPPPVIPYNVVHAHSFVELTMGVDTIKTPLDDQKSLQSAVEHESQERFTVSLRSSGSSPISAEANLPG